MKPKTLFFSSLVAAAAMSAVPAWAGEASANSVLINFNADMGTSSAEGTWNDTVIKANTNRALVDSTGADTGMTASWNATGMWRVSAAAGNILNGFLDDNNSGTNVEITIGVSNISYLAYDVSIYCATDGGSAFSAKTVNGSTYTYADGATVIGNTSWGGGASAGTTIAEGSTYFTISGLFGDLSISSKGDNVGYSSTGKTRGSIAAVTIVDSSVEYSPTLSGSSGLTWTSSELAGTTWKNANAENGWSYANIALSADTGISVSGDVTTIAIIATADGTDENAKTLTLSGDAVNLIGSGVVRTDSDTANIVINNTLNFANGGKISGNVTVGDKAAFHVSDGTLNVAALATAATSVNVSLDSGATYVMDLSAAAATHDLSNITGASGSVISIAGNSSADTFTGISKLSSDFNGAVKITSGYLNLADPSVMNGSNVEKIILSGGTESGLCFVRKSVTISKDIVAEGNGGALRSYGSNSYSVEFAGNVSGTSIRHWDGGTHTFSGTVTLDSFQADAGVTVFSGETSKSIGKIVNSATTKVGSGTTLNITGTGTSENWNTFEVSDGGSANFTTDFKASAWSTSSEVSKTLTVGENATLSVGGMMSNDSGLTLTNNGLITAGTVEYATGNTWSRNTVSGNGYIVADTFHIRNQTQFVFQNNTYVLGALTFAANGTPRFGDTTIGAKNDWSASKDIALTGTAGTEATTTVFNTGKFDTATKAFSNTEGYTITLSGVLSGAGGLTKTGAGTLTLSGENTFEGGVTISAGTLVANNDSALGAAAGSVKLSGGQLEISSSITLAQTNITIALSDAYSGTAAILGAGALASGTKITLTTADETMVASLVEQTTKVYQIFASDSSLASNFSIDSFTLDNEAWADWKISEYDTSSGVITLVMIPEPSAFGLLAGVGALALVVARRRRRSK